MIIVGMLLLNFTISYAVILQFLAYCLYTGIVIIDLPLLQ